MTSFQMIKKAFFTIFFIITVLLFQLYGSALANAAVAQIDLPKHVINKFGTPPPVPTGPLSNKLQAAVEVVFDKNLTSVSWSTEQSESLLVIKQAGDPRLAWLVSDLMRFISQPTIIYELADTVDALLGITFANGNYWGMTTDQLIAWDIPAPPNYLHFKSKIFNTMVPGWENIFVEGDIDWRHVTWGGVLIDDRKYNTTDEACNCIPAADNPKVSNAKDAKWLKDTDIIFGIEVNGEYRAYPRRIMEVREMVNDTLGGRDLGIPYCTLCGSAQAFYTDQLPAGVKRPIFRTSGLLIRSNKVMYDITSNSVFNTFRGNAVTGPLAKKNIRLKQAGVITTTWGAWKKSHPKTTVLKEYLALGKDFDFSNNRDANGPIFPIGDVDPRLPVHEDVIGVVTSSGQAIAFQRSKAILKLIRGEKLEYENIQLILDSDGVKALDKKGIDIGGHQAFWFAWSQFYPGTKLWTF